MKHHNKNKRSRFLSCVRRGYLKRLNRQDAPLCYSSNGLLVDLLEDNGFVVLELYGADADIRDFYVRVRPMTEDPRIKERLARQLKSKYRIWPL
jgi:hypothetical protein